MAVVITRTADPAGVASSANITSYLAASIGTAAHDRVVAVVCGGEVATNTPNSATIDYGAGDVAMLATNLATFGNMRARVFYLHVGGAATAADIMVTWSGAVTAVQNHIAVYSVSGAKGALNTSGTNTSTDMDVTVPLTTGSSTIPADGGMLAIAVGATDTVAKTWVNLAEDLDADAGDFRFTTATSTTAGAAIRTCFGTTNNEDGAMAWVIFDPNASVEALPAQGDLAFSTVAPLVVEAENISLAPPPANLVLSSSAPIVEIVVGSATISPAQGNLALSSTTPIVVATAHRTLSPAVADLILSGSAPSVVQTTNVLAAPATVQLTLSTESPSLAVGDNVALSPSVAQLVLSGVAPTVERTANIFVSPATANLVLSTALPVVERSLLFGRVIDSASVAFRWPRAETALEAPTKRH